MKNLLGGKGAKLAEMEGHHNLKLPVPPGFTLTTDVCTYYYNNKRKYPPELLAQAQKAMLAVEKEMGKKFGDVKNPLLVSAVSYTHLDVYKRQSLFQKKLNSFASKFPGLYLLRTKCNLLPVI